MFYEIYILIPKLQYINYVLYKNNIFRPEKLAFLYLKDKNYIFIDKKFYCLYIYQISEYLSSYDFLLNRKSFLKTILQVLLMLGRITADA